MGQEIERKYLVTGDGWRQADRKSHYRQGYLAIQDHGVVRIRVSDDKAWLTIKGKMQGIVRSEFEYQIPLAEANQMLDQLSVNNVVEKMRYFIDYKGMLWEVDEFLGDNEGLLLAEVELEHEEQEVSLPDWVGQDVSTEQKYHNAYLSKYPYKTWK